MELIFVEFKDTRGMPIHLNITAVVGVVARAHGTTEVLLGPGHIAQVKGTPTEVLDKMTAVVNDIARKL